MNPRYVLIVCALVLAIVQAATAQAPLETSQRVNARIDQTDRTAKEAEERVDRAEQRMSGLEQRVNAAQREAQEAATAGGASFLFGAFCALWAQNTSRNAWLWFFLGLFFSVITVIFLLYKNSSDRKAAGFRAEY
jgi:uncharacterized MAPEG superfamily protein